MLVPLFAETKLLHFRKIILFPHLISDEKRFVTNLCGLTNKQYSTILINIQYMSHSLISGINYSHYIVLFRYYCVSLFRV
jgi:hypothetical protein